MSDVMSAQPCGCDKGAQWVCELHREKADSVNEDRAKASGRPVIPSGEEPAPSRPDLIARRTIADWHAGWNACLGSLQQLAAKDPNMRASYLLEVASAGSALVEALLAPEVR